MENKEIWMETTHGRKKKCKTEFKAVVNKVLVSTLILTTVLGSATPAFAANVPVNSVNNNNSNISYTQEYGVSVKASIQNIQNTVNTINALKLKGTVSTSTLKTLANQLYSLETAARTSGTGVTTEIKTVISNAEKAIQGLNNASEVQVALTVVKASLGIDTVTVASKQATLKSFKDVAADHWAHDAIMKMVDMGMFAGTTTPDANGVGTFSPDSTMTRAQFITVVTRYLYADEIESVSEYLQNQGGESKWYTANYIVAVNNGLLTKNELGGIDGMVNPMTRQEMAMVLVRACDAKGEAQGSTVSSSRIPDYNEIGTAYRSYVKVAYTKGLIAGTNSQGTFNPKGTLTRAQAATVLYRLVDESSRNPIDVTSTSVNPGVAVTGTSWVEGQAHSRADVKVGATVIKADGTKVVLTETKVGDLIILGYGQGVDPYSGLTLANGSTAKEGTASWYDNSVWVKDNITGSMHSSAEWSEIRYATFPGREKGSYEGEVRNTYWGWSTEMSKWLWIGPAFGN